MRLIDRYLRELEHLENFRAVFVDPRCEPVFWFTSFLCEDAEKLSAFLGNKSIQTRRFFYPLHQQPCYADRRNVRVIDTDFSVSESVYRRGISLPSSFGLTSDDQSHVIEQIGRFYAGGN